MWSFIRKVSPTEQSWEDCQKCQSGKAVLETRFEYPLVAVLFGALLFGLAGLNALVALHIFYQVQTNPAFNDDQIVASLETPFEGIDEGENKRSISSIQHDSQDTLSTPTQNNSGILEESGSVSAEELVENGNSNADGALRSGEMLFFNVIFLLGSLFSPAVYVILGMLLTRRKRMFVCEMCGERREL